MQGNKGPQKGWTRLEISVTAFNNVIFNNYFLHFYVCGILNELFSLTTPCKLWVSNPRARLHGSPKQVWNDGCNYYTCLWALTRNTICYWRRRSCYRFITSMIAEVGPSALVKAVTIRMDVADCLYLMAVVGRPLKHIIVTSMSTWMHMPTMDCKIPCRKQNVY
jgi:hypothetical protein